MVVFKGNLLVPNGLCPIRKMASQSPKGHMLLQLTPDMTNVKAHADMAQMLRGVCSSVPTIGYMCIIILIEVSCLQK